MTKEIEYEWNEELMELIPVEKQVIPSKMIITTFHINH